MSWNDPYGTAIPPAPGVCVHGMPWSSACAQCGRGYPSPTPPTINQWIDLSPVTAALERIEGLLRELLGQVSPDAERE